MQKQQAIEQVLISTGMAKLVQVVPMPPFWLVTSASGWSLSCFSVSCVEKCFISLLELIEVGSFLHRSAQESDFEVLMPFVSSQLDSKAVPQERRFSQV